MPKPQRVTKRAEPKKGSPAISGPPAPLTRQRRCLLKPGQPRRAPNRAALPLPDQSIIPEGFPLPQIPLVGRCKVCRLHALDPSVADQVNFNLLSGGQLTAIKGWLDGHGHPEISMMNLSRHANRHLDAWHRAYLHYQATGAALASVLRDAPPDEVAVTAVKQGMVLVGALIADAQGPKDPNDNRPILDRIGDPKFLERLLDRQIRYAEALARAEASRQRNALAARNMRLRELLVAQREKDFVAAAEAVWEQMRADLSPAARADIDAMLSRRRESAPRPVAQPSKVAAIRGRKALTK